MKSGIVKILFFITMLVGIIVSSGCVNADPAVDNIITDPASPTHQSTITITAKVTGDDVTSVNLTVLECKVGLCFPSAVYQMSQNEAGDWVTEATLLDGRGKSTYIEYIFEIVDSGVEYFLDEDWKVDLSIETNSNGEDNGSPGFEIITILSAIFIGIILFRKKRF